MMSLSGHIVYTGFTVKFTASEQADADSKRNCDEFFQEMRLEKPPLLQRQRTDPSKPNSQSGVGTPPYRGLYLVGSY
jgi:hypothetical protein